MTKPETDDATAVPCHDCRLSFADTDVRYIDGCEHYEDGWFCQGCQLERANDEPSSGGCDECNTKPGDTYAVWAAEIEVGERYRFLNRLRILRSIDQHEVPELDDTQWRHFRDKPPEFVIRCGDAAAEHIWEALRKREKR